MTISGVEVEVVGVAGDTRFASLDAPADRLVYVPMVDATGEGGVEGMTLTVRADVAPLSLVRAIRAALAEIEPDMPIADVRPMRRVVGDSMSRTSFTASVLTIAALVAVFLGAVGVYAVLSYIVSQRTTEIGIRTALGATPATVRRMVVLQGLLFVGGGVLIGLAAALALARLLATQLYGVSPVDPLTIGVAAGLFAAVALVASVLPAARAAGTAPLNALRTG
jgi:ABC-type antimicrobial peptide transport system permease subunit